MKKICSLILLLLCVGLGASAAHSKYKLYVNPGHGGYTSNDRQTTMPKVNGVALPVGANGYNNSNCFWESSGNTYRALGIRYFWNKRVVSAGLADSNSIKLSRSENTQDGDLTLSTIAAASSSYGGYFMSLHTNAGNNSANYMIVMYSATSSSNPSGERVSGSKAMATAAAKWHDAVNLTNETYDTPRAMTDRDFYGGTSLGVLRTNSAPGYLAESWFHDYRPEAFRMCSEGYNYFLAWQLMRAYLDSPGWSDVKLYPIIVGDIRDLSKSCGYTSYTTRGRDKYLAINGATVTLRNVATGGTKTYTTDEFNNGFYTFYDCVYGATYEITVSKEGYKTKTQTVTVGTTDTQHKLNFDLEEGTNSGIAVSPTSVDFGEITAETTSSKTVTVTGTDLTSAISVSSSNTTEFSLSTTSIAAAGGSFTITYKPTAAGNHSTTITLTSGSHSKTIVVSGSAKNPPLSFTEVWNYSETSGKSVSWATTGTPRNLTFGAGKLYVSIPSEGRIVVVKAQTAEYLYDLDMTGVDGGALAFCDVKYIDGKILASNIATSSDGNETLKVYVWDNDSATPRVLLETTDIGGASRVGDTFYIKGNLTNGGIYYATSHGEDDTKIVSYAITDGTCSKTATINTITEDGSQGIAFGLAPRVIAGETGRFWVTGQNYYPSLFDEDGLVTQTLNAEALNNDNAGNTFTPFTYKGTSYAFATAYTYNATASERVRDGRAILVDATAGWSNAEQVAEYPAAGLGNTRNTSYSSSIEVAVNGTSGIEMWVLVHNQGIAYYKSGTVPTYSYDPVPEITAPSSVEMTATEGQSSTQTITVEGSLLTGNISVTLSGNSAFSIDKTSLGTTGGTITVTYAPASVGEHTATITLASEGATTKTITLNGTAEAAIAQGLTKVWQNTTNVPGSAAGGDVRFAGVSNGKLIANDKANNKIIEITETGYSDYYDPSTVLSDHYSKTIGTAITCDDAGNILVNTSFSAAASGSSFSIISADLTTSAKLDLSAVTGYTAARVDQVGRVVGNMLSSEGAYIFLLPNGSTQALIVKVVNGAIDENYTQLSTATGVTHNNEYIAQPAFSKVSEIDNLMDENGDLSNSFVMRGRAVPGSVYMWNSDASAMEAFKCSATTSEGYTTTNASVNGFDWFKLYDKSYYIMPMTTDGTTNTRGSVFGIFDNDGNIVAAWSEGEKTGLGGAMGSFIAVPNNDYSVFIYHFVPGTVAEKFTFAVTPQTTGVGEIIDSVEAAEAVIVVEASTVKVLGVDAAMIQLYSMSGACVGAVNNSNELDASGLAGLYVAVVKDVNGVVRAQKVVIR